MSSMTGGVEMREMGESHGIGTYAVQPFRVGDVLLRETPLVFAQYLASRRGPAALICCRGCGTILTGLLEECKRLAYLAQLALQQREEEEEEERMPLDDDNNNNSNGVGAKNSHNCAAEEQWETICDPLALYDTLKEFSTSKFFLRGFSAAEEEDGDGDAHVSSAGLRKGARFCCNECRERCIGKGGGRFLLLRSNAAAGLTDAYALQKPSADTIMRCAANLDVETTNAVWPSKTHVLDTLDYLADTFNERLHLILALLARCLNDTFAAVETTAAAAATTIPALQVRFSVIVHDLITRYAEGAARSLTEQQRAFLRFSWKCVCRWLSLCCIEDGKCEEDDEGGGKVFMWLPLQLYLRCFWLADANVHMFVVVSPVYSLLCQQLPMLEGVCRQNTECGLWSASRVRNQIGVLRHLFRVVNPCAAHATGVALYAAATKINHSCLPSVRFVPTHGAVRAVVVALRDIDAGEEIRSSYIDVVAHASKLKRREYLLTNYGFNCDCPLCSDE